MKVDPDYERLSYLEDEPTKQHSGIKWIFIIVIGVFLGNVLSYATYETYTFWRLKIAMEAATAGMEKQTTLSLKQSKLRTQQNLVRQQEIRRQNTERQKQINSQNAERKRQIYAQSSVNKQLQKTCDFWRQQVKRENTASNRSNQDLACLRVKSSYRKN